jgi:hypothetical protein
MGIHWNTAFSAAAEVRFAITLNLGNSGGTLVGRKVPPAFRKILVSKFHCNFIPSEVR